MAKALVINASGDILRQLRGDPTMFAAQIDTGEELYAVVETTDSGLIEDDKVLVNGTGEIEVRLGETLDYDLPDLTLELIVA